MSDSVKFIFRIILKVPILIVIAYAIFNAFGFGVSYFRMLGLSYVALQTAVENNYIPPDEESSLNRYMQNNLSTDILQNVSFTADTDLGESSRKQYGETVTVGVQAHYKFLWPLSPKEQTVGETGVDGMNNDGRFSGTLSEQELEDARAAYDNPNNNIVIEYKVPGLRYYSDLDN